MPIHFMRRLWRVALLVALTLVAHVGYYALLDDGTQGKSTAFRLLALAITAYAILLSVIALALQRTTTDSPRFLRWKRRLSRWHIPYITVTLLICLAFGFFMRPEWVYVHMGAALIVGFALLYFTFYSDHTLNIPTRFSIALGLLIVCLVMFIRAYGLSVYPYTNITDEPWVFSWAYSFNQVGYLSDWMMPFGGADIPGFITLPAVWMKLIGVGWWQMRLFMLLLTLPLIVLSAGAAYNLYNTRAAWLTAALMFASALVMSMTSARHDIGLAFSLAASIYLYSVALKKEASAGKANSWHFAAGLAMGTGLWSHYHAVGFGVALLVAFYLPRYLTQVRTHKQYLPDSATILYGLGGIVSASVIFVFQILPVFENFVNKRLLNDPQSLLRNPQSPELYLQALAKHIEYIGFHSQLWLVLLIVAFVALVVRRQRADVTLLLTITLTGLVLPLMTSRPNAFPYQILPLVVFYAIAVAALFSQISVGKYANLRNAALVSTAFVVLMSMGETISTPLNHLLRRQPLTPPPPPAAVWLAENASPTDDIIVSQHYYFFWLYEYRFVSPYAPSVMPVAIYETYGSDAAVWQAIAPTYVLIDRNLSDCCLPQPIYDEAWLTTQGYHIIQTFEGRNTPILLYAREG